MRILPTAIAFDARGQANLRRTAKLSLDDSLVVVAQIESVLRTTRSVRQSVIPMNPIS